MIYSVVLHLFNIFRSLSDLCVLLLFSFSTFLYSFFYRLLFTHSLSLTIFLLHFLPTSFSLYHIVCISLSLYSHFSFSLSFISLNFHIARFHLFSLCFLLPLCIQLYLCYYNCTKKHSGFVDN